MACHKVPSKISKFGLKMVQGTLPDPWFRRRNAGPRTCGRGRFGNGLWYGYTVVDINVDMNVDKIDIDSHTVVELFIDCVVINIIVYQHS